MNKLLIVLFLLLLLLFYYYYYLAFEKMMIKLGPRRAMSQVKLYCDRGETKSLKML